MTVFNVFFSSAYWYRNAGICFNQKSLGDPAKQIEDRVRQRNQLIHKWESLGIPADLKGMNEDDPSAPVVRGYGVATVSMIFGCRGIFSEELDPYAESLDLDDEAVLALTPETDFSSNPIMRDLEEQADWLVKTRGKAQIAINMQSVPNIAFKLRGNRLMYDFYENPGIVHKLADYIRQSWINLRTYVSRINKKNGCPDDGSLVTLDNCTVALVSPDIYREFFLPCDMKTAVYYRRNFGVHHCGANMDLFADDYARLGQGVWFDIGYGSDVKACMNSLYSGGKKPFWSVRYGPAKLRSSDPGEIRREREFLGSCGADSVSCVGVDPDTPDQNLKALLIPDY